MANNIWKEDPLTAYHSNGEWGFIDSFILNQKDLIDLFANSHTLTVEPKIEGNPTIELGNAYRTPFVMPTDFYIGGIHYNCTLSPDQLTWILAKVNPGKLSDFITTTDLNWFAIQPSIQQIVDRVNLLNPYLWYPNSPFTVNSCSIAWIDTNTAKITALDGSGYYGDVTVTWGYLPVAPTNPFDLSAIIPNITDLGQVQDTPDDISALILERMPQISVLNVWDDTQVSIVVNGDYTATITANSDATDYTPDSMTVVKWYQLGTDTNLANIITTTNLNWFDATPTAQELWDKMYLLNSYKAYYFNPRFNFEDYNITIDSTNKKAYIACKSSSPYTGTVTVTYDLYVTPSTTPYDIDLDIPTGTDLGQELVPIPTETNVLSWITVRVKTANLNIDIDQLEVSNITANSATVTAADYAVDYTPGSSTTVIFDFVQPPTKKVVVLGIGS